MTKKEKINTIRVLKKAKAYLDSPDKLVKDWGNYYEYKDGTGSWCNSNMTKKKLPKVCKVCALGATVVARYSYKLDGRDKLARLVLEQVSMKYVGSYFCFGTDHTLEEVHELYDKAIEYVENL